MSDSSKPRSYFLRPHFVYFSLATLVVVHVFAWLTSTPASIQLIVNSMGCLYVGAMSTSKIRLTKDNKLEKEVIDNGEEKMTHKDAAMFPVYLSGYLFGLYVLFKLIDKALLSALLSGFFSMMGVLCLQGIIEDAIVEFFPVTFATELVFNRILRFNFILFQKEAHIKLTRLNILVLGIALVPITIYLGTKNWLCNNLVGIAFSVAGIANFTLLPNFKTGFIMLWGLFFYDIFWVYGTDVMLTVAKSVDAPIKLMFPYNWMEEPPKFSMLGLGDIVIPGVFVALCLKYDVDRQIKTARRLSDIDTGYFNWCFVGYVIGIVTTFAVMVIFEHPQPALLFLVPGCTFSALLKAVRDGKMKEFWAYEQEDVKPPATTTTETKTEAKTD